MDIQTTDYRVWYDANNQTINCKGSLRLSGMEEYTPIVQLLTDVSDREQEKIVLNLRDLDFLNSSGINVLSKFVLKIRQKGNIKLIVKGSNNIPWQGKSLKNLQRLMPSLQLEWE